MYTISSLYPIVSRVVAVVLLAAGGLKVKELVIAPTSTTLMPWAIIVLTMFELLFALWLLIGLYPRLTRIIALVCFAIFLNVALVEMLQGRSSCGCFGKAPVPPWVAVSLDALTFGALLLSPSSRLSDVAHKVARIRGLAFAVSTFLMLLAFSWLLATKLEPGTRPIPTQVAADMPTSIDASALERVIQGVERNRAALHTLVYTTETTQTSHAVKWPSWISRPVWDGKKIVTGSAAAALAATIPESEPVEKISRHSYKSWICGDELRQDCLTHYEGGRGGEILTCTKGKCIKYAPELRQAWISTGDFLDEGLTDPIDMRCAGFQPPLKSIADWLKHCELLNAGLVKVQNGQEIIRVHARVKKHQGKIEDDVTADFATAMNCMPTRVVYKFFPNGGVFTVTDLDYQQVGPNGAWFPRRIAQRSFFRNTTSDPDAPTGQNISQQDTVKVLAEGQGVRDEDFDPILPAGILLVGDLPTRSWTGDVPVRASKIIRREPRPINRTTPLQKGENLARQPRRWSLVIGMDLLLLGVCLRFRKRFAF